MAKPKLESNRTWQGHEIALVQPRDLQRLDELSRQGKITRYNKTKLDPSWFSPDSVGTYVVVWSPWLKHLNNGQGGREACYVGPFNSIREAQWATNVDPWRDWR